MAYGYHINYLTYRYTYNVPAQFILYMKRDKINIIISNLLLFINLFTSINYIN